MASTAASDQLAQALLRVALRDRAAFEQVYRLTSAHLLGVAHAVLQRRDWAEDVLQDAFMNVWHNAASFNPAIAGPMTWLINVVRNKAIDRLRAAKGERAATLPLDDEALALADDAARQPQQMLDESLTRAQISACMAGLSAAQRQALALAYYRGLAHGDIAATLGAPLGTVKAWVRRGIDKLKDCLEAAGVRSP